MALTDKKRRFVDALLSGLSGAKAAIHAGYSENGAAQAAARLMRDKHVLAALGRSAQVNKSVNKKPVNKTAPQAKPASTDGGSQDTATGSDPMDEIGLKALGLTSDPRAVLVAIMNDVGEEPKLRLEAAKALMPFTHGKIAEQGKKGAKQEAANKAATGGRFAPPPPPTHLRVVGKG
ncbi:terminase small subunit [Achromobacter aegrifaciens]|uniref:terminase small subunit n=1 Tax=Achromobacter aegrifaciens TaxID=1287736 RepID=UPI000F73C497|nr:terminase small subunit [Achromobacter aegrifaciens]RSF08815.1 terminase small subunit [Achromobacter aegrifaciens]